MKVKELVKILKKLNQNKDIIISSNLGMTHAEVDSAHYSELFKCVFIMAGKET